MKKCIGRWLLYFGAARLALIPLLAMFSQAQVINQCHAQSVERKNQKIKSIPSMKRGDESATLHVRNGCRVVVQSNHRRTVQVSASARNLGPSEAHDVRLYVRGIGGVLIQLRGPSRIRIKGTGYYTGTVRELLSGTTAPVFVSTCRECKNP